jgi:hypothetical protein
MEFTEGQGVSHDRHHVVEGRLVPRPVDHEAQDVGPEEGGHVDQAAEML